MAKVFNLEKGFHVGMFVTEVEVVQSSKPGWSDRYRITGTLHDGGYLYDLYIGVAAFDKQLARARLAGADLVGSKWYFERTVEGYWNLSKVVPAKTPHAPQGEWDDGPPKLPQPKSEDKQEDKGQEGGGDDVPEDPVTKYMKRRTFIMEQMRMVHDMAFQFAMAAVKARVEEGSPIDEDADPELVAEAKRLRDEHVAAMVRDASSYDMRAVASVANSMFIALTNELQRIR